MDANEGPRVWQAEEGLHVDVRGLPCPEPMVTVLQLIDSGMAEDFLVAHLSQEPLLLYPELNERGWRHRLRMTDQPTHVALEMTRPRA
ncbi:hypothetical protein M2323_002819 [Rhodoblastus acidophilus]|uniref:DUF2249 domain-containing protein n=1 Tax=Rhodoblastus acidophilus TaxID=1074 RepID=UPI0022249638|nr:DUF2249 domain-containing protein [Rhodoblastus acidophilus]MCW2284827.1 hypothetical protein [Rhodoblastus acidophilus]MCW2333883.1 hypothetical protein [Rhodoblastus acidophilus]